MRTAPPVPRRARRCGCWPAVSRDCVYELVVDVDCRLRLTWADPRLVELTGYQADELETMGGSSAWWRRPTWMGCSAATRPCSPAGPGRSATGCGSWGGNSISENLDYKHLMNISRIGKVIVGKKVPTDAEIWA